VAPPPFFFLTANEVAFGDQRAEAYFLYRLFDFDSGQNSGRAFILTGRPGDALQLTATAYRAELMAGA
jgi:hypothetical protein